MRVITVPPSTPFRPPQGNRLWQVYVLIAAGCLTTMTGGVVSPVLPEMVQELALSPQWAGTLVSIHALAIALFTPLFGWLADRIGKRTVLIPSLLLYALFGVAGAVMNTLPLLLTTRVLLGISSAAIAAASIGLLATLFEGAERSRMLGYATSAMTIASIIIPIVGGWVGATEWRYAFYLYGFGLPVALWAAITLREPSSGGGSLLDPEQNQTLFATLRRPAILQIYGLIVIAAAIVYTVVIYTPLYLKEIIDADPALNGAVLGIRAVGAAVMSAFAASRLARRFGVQQTIAFGFITMAFMLLTIPLLNELHWIIPAAVLFGMGFGITIPNIYDILAGLAPSEVRATVLAVGTGANSLGQFISPLLLGPVWNSIGLTAVFYSAGAIALILGLQMAFLPLTSTHQP
ncbi:MFS transporter [Spirulina sp. CCNP1310]|uniref:MFS transporter n=1 Tax=Spirulina sp. CCNP1310 TaxID=3110249 RepID=UPI002B203A40|nr:MFS transporter [Spirulina sp. CCNP1310]MEA5420127.1 MFS transporter [Spirulina sp. CCNP1310]